MEEIFTQADYRIKKNYCKNFNISRQNKGIPFSSENIELEQFRILWKLMVGHDLLFYLVYM